MSSTSFGLIFFVLVFFDDILVYSKSEEEYEEHVKKVLHLLRKHQLFAKRSKCTFCNRHIEYLIFIISEEGIFVDPAKVKDIIEWPLPALVSEIRGFLGIIRWYTTFLRNYALIATPLTNLVMKGSKINWETQHQ